MVDPLNLDTEPGPYCMSFGTDPESLKQSLKSIGLINPPIVMANKGNGLSIIIGYRRIITMKSLGYMEIPCRVLDQSSISPLNCFLLNFYDNLGSRILNDVEKGMALSRLSLYLTKKEILKHYMGLLGLPSHESTFVFYCRMDKELDKDIKESIVQGRLSLFFVKMLLEADAVVRRPLFDLVANIRLNFNQQKQFLEYIQDISKDNSTAILQFLAHPSINKICLDPRMNHPQKARALLQFVRNERFPNLARAESTFRKAVSRLGLPKGVRIDAPPFFEAPHYQLSIQFKEGIELKKAVESLSKIEKLDELGDPW